MRPIRMMGDWGNGCCLAGGDSYGASLSSSESSAASASGTTDASSGQYLFGTTYGPGSYVAAMTGSGASGGTGGSGLGVSVSTPFIIGAVLAVAAAIWFFSRRR
jgi:hypothetical protein